MRDVADCRQIGVFVFFFFTSRRRHTRCLSDWSSDVCSSDLGGFLAEAVGPAKPTTAATPAAAPPARTRQRRGISFIRRGPSSAEGGSSHPPGRRPLYSAGRGNPPGGEPPGNNPRTPPHRTRINPRPPKAP